MASYPRDAPTWSGQAGGYYTYSAAPVSHVPLSSSPRMQTTPRSAPAYDQLAVMMPRQTTLEAYMHKTFKDFADHAYTCDVCYDPLRVQMEGGRLCSRGNKLARKISKAFHEEANEKYHRVNSSRHHTAVWKSIGAEIPEGCEIVRPLINAMNRGLDISSRSDDSHHTYYQRRPGPSSDEELYSRSRSRHRDELETAGRSRSAKRSSSAGNAVRKPVVIGIQERERRPYGGSHSSHGSTDSGYDTAPGSPDTFRRGSQYAQDIKRRKERPKSILKNPISFDEREHLLEKDPKAPRSPIKGTSQEKCVFFKISGEHIPPGFD
ncbi:hypothetical protein DRE_03918 [Drechslerella stenobrocha 248]|uniref:Uncharacterized protein n=1 Tax=Drechslerella stenobrocha 248 TaxID=1043628 RepID=W7HS45_9PEZI|nr:hypothetical protein DRE_03918 [Drechslerella stenobrocha 248]